MTPNKNAAIKAIQTRYKGYNFRSRLEARWAVFFDALGYKWEYEPEGFVLSTGAHYLPDFHIKGVDSNGEPFDYWGEVKPDHVLSQAECEKIDAFGYGLLATTSRLFVLSGVPEVKAYECVGSHPHFLWGAHQRPWMLLTGETQWPEAQHSRYATARLGGGNPFVDLLDACDAARSARFEHGQSGASL